MIDWIGYGWMAGDVKGPSTYFADLTLEVPRGDVVAAAAVTGFSVGVFQDEPGSVAVYVREYAQWQGGKPVVVDVPPDPINNALLIADCFFVRFRLTVFQARAQAQGLVFRFAPPPPPAAAVKPPKFDIHDYHLHVGGKDVGRHRVMALGRKSRLPVDAILRRSAAEAARFLGVRHRDVETVRARKARGRREEAVRARIF